MDHADHVALIRGGVPTLQAGDPPARWADIGAGEGAFTLALADLLGPGASIVAVDRDRGALETAQRRVRGAFPATHLTTQVADLTTVTGLPRLDGLVIANALHFVERPRQVAAVRHLAASLRPGGRFIVVEYDADAGNQWVPWPFTYRGWEAIAAQAGLRDSRPIGRVPSRFLGAIHAAVSETAH